MAGMFCYIGFRRSSHAYDSTATLRRLANSGLPRGNSSFNVLAMLVPFSLSTGSAPGGGGPCHRSRYGKAVIDQKQLPSRVRSEGLAYLLRVYSRAYAELR